MRVRVLFLTLDGSAMEGEPPRCDRRCLGAATAAEAALWGLGQCGGLTRSREMRMFVLKKYSTNLIYLYTCKHS
jgi:hypothetical protein